MKVLVCGGRDYDKAQVWNALEHIVQSEICPWPPTCLIHGAARGADEGAAEWAKSEGIKSIAYPANWRKHGKAAGPMRNQKMIDEAKPDAVVAFPGGRGTADMVRRAYSAGIPVVEINDTLTTPPNNPTTQGD